MPGSSTTLRPSPDSLVQDAIGRMTSVPGPSPTTSPGARILAAVDGTPATDDVAAWTLFLARATGGRVDVVTVMTPPAVPSYDAAGFGWWPQLAAEYERAQEAGRAAHLSVLARLDAGGIRAQGHVRTGTPAAQISSLAHELAADLLVLGTHDRSRLGRLLLGSVADGVKDRAQASILFARGPPAAGRILVAVDGSAASRRAAAMALRLAEAWDARLDVLHVVERPSGILAASSLPLDDTLQGLGLPEMGRVRYHLSAGKVPDAILAHATTTRAGLIVLGSRGLGRIQSALIGSVGRRVAHEASTSVLLVREDAE